MPDGTFFVRDNTQRNYVAAKFLKDLNGNFVVSQSVNNAGIRLFSSASENSYLGRNEEGFIIVPADFDIKTAIDFGKAIGLTRNSLLPIRSPFSVISDGIFGSAFLPSKGWLDVQTHYNGTAGPNVPGFTAAASYILGVAGKEAGYSVDELLKGGGVVNRIQSWLGNVKNTSDTYGNNPDNATAIKEGYSAQTQKLFGSNQSSPPKVRFSGSRQTSGQSNAEPVQTANGVIAGEPIGSDLGSALGQAPAAAIAADNASAAPAPATEDTAAAPPADGVEPEQAGEEARSRRLSRSQRQSRKIGFLTTEISELRRQLAEQGGRASDDRPAAEPQQEFLPPPQSDFSGDTLADERASNAGPIREPDAVQEDAESPRQEQAIDRAAGDRQQAAAAHLARIDQAKQRIPDFDQVIRSGGQVPIAPGVADEILNSEKSALLQYHLAGNPAKLAELNGLSGSNLTREIGRLEGRLYLPTARTVTEASPPLSDVRGGAAPAFDPHKTDDMDAFASWLREDQARRRRA